MDGRNMSRVYRHMTLEDCLELRSRKLSQIRTLERRPLSYLGHQELRRVRFNLAQLEKEIGRKWVVGILSI